MIDMIKSVTLDVNQWETMHFVIFSSIILIGLEILAHLVPFVFGHMEKIEIQGLHLDKLESIDQIYITINKLLTVMFVYHLILVCSNCDTIYLKLDEVTIYNTIGSLCAFYFVYDFFYMNFHRFLHQDFIYPYVHKHHHRQKAPSRGNLDAINVHPFEFVVGEYLHLLTIYLIPCHIYTVAFFIILGGILASLNHTRFDVKIPGFFSVKVHDVHHVKFNYNYAQYTMYWDQLFGTYKDWVSKTA